MDEQTPEGLFARTTDIKNTKSRNSELQVFVSLGGWTFSDNNTATQPLFSQIAADEDKRTKFADNLLGFMVRYGFDGVDLDWEYPGASDRGGNKDDTKNFVALMKAIRDKFDASARGVWDQNNPIGSKVHPHTNLTEIKEAASLLWRNDVPPAKVVLGVGFYGRSFHLKDKECNTPGCDFEGDAQEGDCTKSSGTLAYFEIQDIIKKQNINVTYDKDAAVNWITYGKDLANWVSYDDNRTLSQKVDYANDVGLGGVMIWSVDQDDESFTALEGLIGKSLPSYQDNMKRTHDADANYWKSLNGQSCQVSKCINNDSRPPNGYGLAPNGKFPDTCSSGQSKFIWCPLSTMPSSCTWRGSGSCHGQCHTGEVTLAHSPHGSKSCLKPGQQAFCCKSNTWAKLTDKCGWGPDCDTCPNDAPYAVSTKKTGFFKDCTIPWCCPYKFENCHWVGKGTCDDNECSATDVQAGLDASGNTGSKCANGWNDRMKPLCCNTPSNMNPFLPASLQDLFPTLPPTEDVPVWDKQSLATGDVAGGKAFFFVLVDGPPDAVTNVNQRDGSHLEFVTGGVHHGQAAQTAHFVCMDHSENSNCDDLYFGGLEGKILRMPDNFGFAKYAVAHAVTASNYTVPHHRLTKRAPLGARVFELTYSYNFSKVKRDSKEIYLRVDYGDRQEYWDEVVEAPHQKRDLHPRFWSKSWRVWKEMLNKFRSKTYESNTKPYLSIPEFDVPIYQAGGEIHGCKDSGWLNIGLKGYMVSGLRFGYTMVGTISPELRLEEAYGFFDSSPLMKATLSFDGKGILDIDSHRSLQLDLLSSPITDFEASHPGIISFSPQLNAGISMVGQGEIDAKFDVRFENSVADTLTTNAPPSIGEFKGDAMPRTFIRDPVSGKLWVGEHASDTVFGLNVNLETSMDIAIHDYASTSIQAQVRFSSRVPRTIRVVSDTGSGKPGIVEVPQQASSDVVQEETIQVGWDDGKTHPVGIIPEQQVLFTGGERPPERSAPPVGQDGAVLFADSEEKYMTCSDIDFDGNLTCTYDFGQFDPDLVAPDSPYKRDLDLLPRAGPNSGNRNHYTVSQNPPPAGGNAPSFQFTTPTYPNGDNGRALNEERDDVDAYSLANPGQCDDPSIVRTGIRGVNYDEVDTEHPIDRSVIPNHFLQDFVQTGQVALDRDDTTFYRTSLPTWTFNNLEQYFAHDYRLWVRPGANLAVPPGSASSDVADALGSSSNPMVLTNLERNLNILKGQTYTTQSNSPSDTTFDTWMQSPNPQNARRAIGSIRATFAVFHYMQAIQEQRQNVIDDIHAALETFDTIYGQVFPNRPERMAPLWAEFQPQWERRVINIARETLTRRLSQIADTYGPLRQSPVASIRDLAVDTLEMRESLERRLNTDLHF
ncbi:hypothetical protein ATERTT37_006259 [Aspergillus terreus]